MKKTVLIYALSLLCVAGFAQQETARVVSVTPVMQQVSTPRQVCSNETVMSAPQKSGAGAAMGAIAGGAVGNSVGGGTGRTAATMIGIIGGAILGDNIEGGDAPRAQTVQRCSTQYIMENRISGYHVIYEFGGKQYSVQMPYDPGPTIKLQLTPISAAPSNTVVAEAAPQVYPVAMQRDPALVIRPSLYVDYSYGGYGRRGWR
jgi:uncharacterized protein YcfJ